MAKGKFVKKATRYVRRRVRRQHVGSLAAILGLVGTVIATATDKAGYPRNTVEYLKAGSWDSALTVLGKAMLNPKNYVPVAVGGGIAIVSRKFMGARVKITKKMALA